MRRLPSLRKRRLRRWLAAARTQIYLACLVMLGGAYLIGLWAVGIMLILAGLLLGADALLRDSSTGQRKEIPSHEDVLDRYRRAR